MMEAVRETGSIAAACRRMGVSYKQAWLLIETMNACFARPLVEAVKGGRKGVDILPPLVVYESAKTYTAELNAIAAGPRASF